jgi:small GTP-binding protein
MIDGMETARRLVRRINRHNPHVVELARLVSLAVRIEPELLRVIRVRLAPHLSAETEADLWFSALVQSRGYEGISFLPDVAEYLRRDLMRDGRREQAWAITRQCHAQISPALQLEEEVTWIALTEPPDAQQHIEAALNRAVASLAREREPGVAYWAARALPRLPTMARRSSAAWILSLVTSQQMKTVRPLADQAPAALFDIDLGHLLQNTSDTTLGVRLFGETLELSGIPAPDSQRIRVPATNPRQLEVRWRSGQQEHRETVAIPSGQVVRRRCGVEGLALTDLRGRRYLLHVPPQTPDQMAGPEEPDARFAWDVFLSCSRQDRPRVQPLAQRLRAAGLRIWWDAWELKPGDNVRLAQERGLMSSRTLILCMSPAAFGQDWDRVASAMFRFLDPWSTGRRFIPVLLQECEIPFALRGYTYIDWRTESGDAFTRLLNTCRPPVFQPDAPQKPPPQETGVSALLGGHAGSIWDVASLPDSRRLLSASSDQTVRLWDVSSGRCTAVFEGHRSKVLSVAASPAGLHAATAAQDGEIRLWDLSTHTLLRRMDHESPVTSLAWTPDATRLLSCGADGRINVWDAASARLLADLPHHNRVEDVAVTPDGRVVASAAADGTITLWNIQTAENLATLTGHSGKVWSVAVTPDGHQLISGSDDLTLRIWDVETRRCQAVCEGHTAPVARVAASPDGRWLASASWDKTVRVWALESLEAVATFTHPNRVNTVAFTPDGRSLLAGGNDGKIYVYRLSEVVALTPAPSLGYQSAKVLLLGSAGTGKSGLALRLVENRFEETTTTHGMRKWRLPLAYTDQDGVEREAFLWDLAGEPDYRLLHPLYFDDAAVAILTIDTAREDGLAEALGWVQALRAALKPGVNRPVLLLVATRTDRADMAVDQAQIQRFMQEHGFSGYVATSAMTGEGITQLRDLISSTIRWDALPQTSAPRHFHRIRQAVLAAAEQRDAALISFAALFQKMVAVFPDEQLDPEVLRTVVHTLARQGYLLPLEFGDLILLHPEVLNEYAAAVIRTVRAHPDGIGFVLEQVVLDARIDFSGVQRLQSAEESLLLRALVQMFLDRALCLVQETDEGRMLVFPSLFSREGSDRPFPAPFVRYTFNGDLSHIFATLVVKLMYSRSFDRYELWRNGADFTLADGAKVGLKLESTSEGMGMISLFAEPAVSTAHQVLFTQLIQQHLQKVTEELTRQRQYTCPRCGNPVENGVARDRLRGGKDFSFCVYCGAKVPLVDELERLTSAEATQRNLQEADVQATRHIDQQTRKHILLGHLMAICGEAHQLFRPSASTDYGPSGEIEFVDDNGSPSGRVLSVLLHHDDSLLLQLPREDRLVFSVRDERVLHLCRRLPHDLYLVIRATTGEVQWMNLTAHLKSRPDGQISQIEFSGERLDATVLLRLRTQFMLNETATR